MFLLSPEKLKHSHIVKVSFYSSVFNVIGGSGLQRLVLIEHTLVFYMLRIHNPVSSNIWFILSHFLIYDYYKSEVFLIFPCDVFRM